MVRSKALWVLLLIALLAAGCGDDSDDPAVGSPPAAEEEDDEPDVDPAADQDAADAAVAAAEERLEAAGFAPGDDDDDDDDLEFESEQCRELDQAFSGDEEFEGETASAESETYEIDAFAEEGYSEMAQVGLSFVEGAGLAEEVFDVLRDAPLAECLEEAFQIAMQKSADDDGVEITTEGFEVDVADTDLGDLGLSIRMTGVFGAMGIELPMDFAIDFVQVDRAVAMLMVGVIGDGESSVDRQALVDEMLQEANAA